MSQFLFGFSDLSVNAIGWAWIVNAESCAWLAGIAFAMARPVGVWAIVRRVHPFPISAPRISPESDFFATVFADRFLHICTSVGKSLDIRVLLL